MNRLIHRKNQAPGDAWSLVESVTTVQLVYNLIWRFDYNTVVTLSQVENAKGGISMWIFRAWITTKDGEKIYAKDHGKRAFRFWVGPGPEPTKKS